VNLFTGEIVELYLESDCAMANVRVGKAIRKVPVSLVEGARVGDWVLVESGVAIARVTIDQSKEG